MNFRKGHGREDPEINLIPFIDVLLVILIFLMVTTTYSKFTALQITLPSEDAEKSLQQPLEIDIDIDAQGRFAINNTRVSASDVRALADELKTAEAAARKPNDKNDPVVKIRADAQIPHHSVMDALNSAKIAGYDKITFENQAPGK